ncbi:MAG: PAS-domain containing protein [Rubrivivax sp.]|jgi:PAS domain S-box-containing protein|nr:PAS-domain containing protein [Rubrivivax sp.]
MSDPADPRLKLPVAMADDQLSMLAMLIEHTEQGVWTIDNELRTTNANPAMCRMLGTTREAMLGLTIYDFVDPENQAVFRAAVARRAAGEAGSYEVTLRRADGEPVYCYNNATPLVDAQGRKVGAVGLFSDITRLKLAQQQIRHTSELLAQKSRMLEATLDALDQGVLSVGSDGRVNAWNRRYLELLGLPEAFVQGRPTLVDLRRYQVEHGLFMGDDNGDDAWQQRLAARRYQRRMADGRLIEVQAFPAADGSLVRTYSDITEQMAADGALRAAKDEAERANRTKSEFLSRMSHELRTPLNAVLGFAQLLDGDAGDPLSPGQRARVQELMRGGRHLLRLINDVLDIARIEAGTLKLRLESVDVPLLVDDCLRLVQPMADAVNIRLSLRPGPAAAARVRADATRLKQVLLNLLSNAIKYNRPGGQVEVAWQLDVAGGVRLDVVDTGPGLGAAQVERLFQAFERLDAAQGAVEGAGIGLALSKWLVELMRGEIGVVSQVGLGSTFWVRLERPAAEGEPTTGFDTLPAPLDLPSVSELLPARQRRGPPRVLYIEDNEVNRLVMKGMLAQRPQIVLQEAEHPEPGLAMAYSCPPDLILLDIQLPGIDGYEVLRRLRSHGPTRSVPVVAVSANALEGDREKAARAGFDAYLTKPVDLTALLALVDRLLQQG